MSYTVTEIKPQKNGKRVNIYLDEKFAFGLDLESLMKANLKVNDTLEEKEVEELVFGSEYKKTLDKLLGYATLRPRSVKEINDWFRKKKVHESMQKKLFNRLEHFDLVDDVKFARWWVKQRNNFRPRSRRMLINELRIKGIDKEITKQVLVEIEIDEIKIAKDLLTKRSYKWDRLDSKVAKTKKSEYLARKGFGWDIIKTVIQ